MMAAPLRHVRARVASFAKPGKTAWSFLDCRWIAPVWLATDGSRREPTLPLTLVSGARPLSRRVDPNLIRGIRRSKFTVGAQKNRVAVAFNNSTPTRTSGAINLKKTEAVACSIEMTVR